MPLEPPAYDQYNMAEVTSMSSINTENEDDALPGKIIFLVIGVPRFKNVQIFMETNFCFTLQAYSCGI